MKCLFCANEINLSRHTDHIICEQCESYYQKVQEKDEYTEFVGYPYKTIRQNHQNQRIRIQ